VEALASSAREDLVVDLPQSGYRQSFADLSIYKPIVKFTTPFSIAEDFCRRKINLPKICHARRVDDELFPESR
jgi:hypothetical protein